MGDKSKFIWELVVNSLIIAVAGFFLNYSLGYSQFTGSKLGAGTFPKGISLLIIILSSVNILLAILKFNKRKQADSSLESGPELSDVPDSERDSQLQPEKPAGAPWMIWIEKNRVIAAIILLFLYLAGLYTLGFLPSTILYLFLMLLLLKHKHNIWLYAIPIAATALVFVAFKILLQVPLPEGLWF